MKNSTWAPFEQAKMISGNFIVSANIFEKTCVLSEKLLTTMTLCQCSQQLFWQDVNMVNDYTDTVSV